tara:strand:- start:596 stop:1378 length:783 start_codon:yes stop_codon:yes gene_type:complete
MDETYNSDPEWNKQNQYHPQNQPRPPGWVDQLTQFHDHYYLSAHYWANLFCELHYSRRCFSPPPLPWPEDIRGLEDLDAVYRWELDDLERRRWGLYDVILKAVAYGKLPTEDSGLPAEEYEEYRHVESRWSEDAHNRGVTLRQIVPWALENNIPVPVEMLGQAGVKETAKRTNEGKAKAAREKRDATFAAALVLIQEHGIESYQHQDSGNLNLSKLGKDIIKEQKKIFEDGTAPLSTTVFTRQFKSMEARYKAEKLKSQD